jgi:hypothetical protein
MNIKEIIKSQYLAALEMLKSAIVKCPGALWDDPAYKNRFWHIAYHTLFYTHLYLQPTESDFVPWTKHREHYESMDPPWPPHQEPEIGEPYRKEEMLEYLEFCQQQVKATVDSLNLDDRTGFHWLPFGKLELQFYNIRHLMQHTGELCERLGATENIEVDWVGKRPD